MHMHILSRTLKQQQSRVALEVEEQQDEAEKEDVEKRLNIMGEAPWRRLHLGAKEGEDTLHQWNSNITFRLLKRNLADCVHRKTYRRTQPRMKFNQAYTVHGIHMLQKEEQKSSSSRRLPCTWA